MRKLIAATLLALSLFAARPAHAQYEVTGYYTGSWVECYYAIFCFPEYWTYITYADGTFHYADSLGNSYTGWY